MAKNTRGRPIQSFRIADVAGALEAEGLKPFYRPITADELGRAKHYRAIAYAPLAAGRYTRAALAEAIGASPRTTYGYDELAGVTVRQNVTRTRLADADADRLPTAREDLPHNVWLESTGGRRFMPTRDGLRHALKASIDHDGQAVAYWCQQGANTYIPPERDASPVGLPVQVRRALIRDGRTSEARIVDALLLAGYRAGDVLTSVQIAAIAGRYGISDRTVRRVLAQAPQDGAEGPQDADVQETGQEHAESPQDGAEGPRTSQRGDTAGERSRSDEQPRRGRRGQSGQGLTNLSTLHTRFHRTCLVQTSERTDTRCKTRGAT